MIFKVFEKFGIDLQQHCSGDFGDFKTYDLNLGDFDALKYAENVDWGCMRVIYSKGLYSIMGYLPTINFNGIKTMLITYTNTNVLRYGQNVRTVKIIEDKLLPNRHLYAYELKDYMSYEENMPGRTSFIYFSDKRSKLEKKEQKVKKRLVEGGEKTVRYLGDRFKFTKH